MEEPCSTVIGCMLPSNIFSLHTVVLVLSLLGAYFTASAIYFTTLHPLADIPGPGICAISRIPYWIKYMNGRDVVWIHSLHQKYGPVLRFGPTDISYTSIQAWKDIYGHTKGKVENPKAREIFLQPINGVPSILIANQDDHTRVRRIFSPAFSERALKAQEPMFHKYAHILLSKLQAASETDKPTELTRLLNFTTFDIMAELCFGHPLGLLEKNEFSPWVRAIFESLKMLPYVTMINYYPILHTIFTRFEPKSITQQRITHCQHAADRVDQRLKEGSDRPDIWNMVMKSDPGLSLQEMHSNAEIFMLAGSETTATLLSGVTYHLLTNPKKMGRLVNEIRQSFTSVDQISFDTLADMDYMNACLKEALRIYPPVPIGLPRITPAEGQVILGKWIPPQARVSVHQYSTYHSPANFTDPDSFVPERWLKDADPAYANDVRDAHQPFSWGPRDCLGRNMAMHEMRLVLASMLFKFDFELCEESKRWPEQETYALWMKNPLMCRVKLAA